MEKEGFGEEFSICSSFCFERIGVDGSLLELGLFNYKSYTIKV